MLRRQYVRASSRCYQKVTSPCLQHAVGTTIGLQESSSYTRDFCFREVACAEHAVPSEKLQAAACLIQTAKKKSWPYEKENIARELRPLHNDGYRVLTAAAVRPAKLADEARGSVGQKWRF
jgi:hypothetical protein